MTISTLFQRLLKLVRLGLPLLLEATLLETTQIQRLQQLPQHKAMWEAKRRFLLLALMQRAA
jgi:hypothetical protein